MRLDWLRKQSEPEQGKAEISMSEAEGSDRVRILEMLQNGKISVEEAEQLLSALGRRAESGAPAESVPMKDSRGRKARKLRILVDAGEGKDARVNMSIPLSLVRTVGPLVLTNMPAAAREQMEKNGVQVDSLLGDIDTMLQENDLGDIVNIDTEKDGKNIKIRICIE